MSELNLIPTSIKEKRAKKLRRNNMINISIIVLSVLFLGLYFPYLILTNSTAEESRLKQQIQANHSIVNEYNAIKAEIEKSKELTGKVQSFENVRSFKTPIIQGLEKYIPAGMTFKSLEYAIESGMKITAEVSNLNEAAAFVANLQSTENYRNCQLDNVTVSSDGKMIIIVTILFI